GRTDSWRLRIHQGLPRRKVLSRRQALHYRRRHQRNPAPRDRAATPQERMISNLRTLARLATGVENRDPAALAELAALAPGSARIVGITGPPGAGKSTLVDALALALRKQGKTVAILAID